MFVSSLEYRTNACRTNVRNYIEQMFGGAVDTCFYRTATQLKIVCKATRIVSKGRLLFFGSWTPYDKLKGLRNDLRASKNVGIIFQKSLDTVGLWPL